MNRWKLNAFKIIFTAKIKYAPKTIQNYKYTRTRVIKCMSSIDEAEWYAR